MSQISDFIQYSILFACFIFTLISQSLLLIKCMKAKLNERLSASILINMFWWCWASIGGMLYMGYRGFFAPAEWNLTLMFSILCIHGFASCAVSASITFVLLDRIYILIYPIKYKKWQKWFILSTFAFCIFGGTMTIVILCLSELPMVSNGSCTTFGCALPHHHGNFATLVKFSVNCLNLIVTLVFQWALCSFTSATSSKNQFTKANRVTMIAFATEFLCNFLPNFIHYTCEILDISELATLGPYQVLLYGADAFGTAIIYRFVIISKRKSKNAIHPGQTLHSNSRHQSSAPVRIE